MIRRPIPIDALRSEAEDWTDFLRKLSARAEEVGILVLRTGIVGNNTHRPLDPHEVAGFAVPGEKRRRGSTVDAVMAHERSCERFLG